MYEYPASNFHDLNLDWLLEQMKNCLAEWEETKTDWENLEADNTEFKSYVTNYLQNLDLSEEVAANIAAMVASGEFLALLTTDEGEGSPLSDVVGAWLADHITQETGYVIDDTLTVQGAAADAKAAGDRIAELKNTVDAMEIKPVRNLVSEVVLGKLVMVNTQQKIVIQDSESYNYVRFPVKAGKTYALSAGASNNFSRWVNVDSTGENWLSNVTIDTGNLITAPTNANVCYLCANGLPTQFVVLEQDTSITGATITQYPYNTTVRVLIPKLYSEENNDFVDDLLSDVVETVSDVSALKKDAIFHTMSDNIRLLGVEYTTPTIILNPSETEAFDDGMIESPMVWWDTNKNKWGMVYTGYKADEQPDTYLYGSIGLAWSEDLEHWTKDANAPILTHSSDSSAPDYGSVTGPVMYMKNGTYYLYYIGCTVAGYEQGRKSLCLATGTDIYNLTKSASNPLIAPTNAATVPEKYYSQQIYHANIVEYMNKYYMFINCNGVHPTQTRYCENTLCFTSTDLINWSFYSVAFPCATDTDSPDYQITGDPCIYDIGDDYLYMVYFRASQNYATSSGGLAKCAKTDFPNGWERMNISPLNSYHKYFVMQWNGNLFIYGSTKRIAMAKAIR